MSRNGQNGQVEDANRKGMRRQPTTTPDLRVSPTVIVIDWTIANTVLLGRRQIRQYRFLM